MLLITCPVTGNRELIEMAGIRSVVNRPGSIDVVVACPCGATHVHRTGRRVEEARRAAALEVCVRRAQQLIPA